MTQRRNGAIPSLFDLYDRVIDKGIVVDASARVAPAGIDLLTEQKRAVIASIQTYLDRS